MTLTVHQGDVIERLRELPEQSVHCVVTSPHYWGLRDYKIPPSVWGGDPDCAHEWGDAIVRSGGSGIQGSTSQRPGRSNVEAQQTARGLGTFCQICQAWRGCHGLEPTPELFVQHEVLIFAEVWRVLRNDGTLWLNLGDSYNNSGLSGGTNVSATKGQLSFRGAIGQGKIHAAGLKPKDLVGIPWRVAFALQAAGWYLRSDIIWHKPNPMPESITDRPTKAHEYLFLMTKGQRYFYDAEAIKERSTGNAHDRGRKDRAKEDHKSHPDELRNGLRPRSAAASQFPSQALRDDDRGRRRKPGVNPKCVEPDGMIKQNTSFAAAVMGLVDTRNKRTIWTVATAPYKDAHFATFPPDLIKPAILAGTSARGCCPHCGAPWRRIIDKVATDKTQKMPDGMMRGKGSHGTIHPDGREKGETGLPVYATATTGWRPACKCPWHSPTPCTVLDPFGGSFTTAQVAIELGRAAIVIEINPDYVRLGRKRLAGITPGLALH